MARWLRLLTALGALGWAALGGRAAGFADLWPQWRGPTRDSLIQGPAWPDKLEGRLEQSWRVELGPSYSGPIVAEDRVFVTETLDKAREVVRALDRQTGKELWRVEWPGALTVPFFAKENGDWIRATPAFDGESLYVAGMRDVLVCLDAKTGAVRWRVDFMERYKTPLPAFGFVSSPLVDGDAIYVQAGASFLKLDKRTGETLWRTLEDDGGMMGSAFSSPIFATMAGQRQLVVQTRAKLAGVDPETGAVLWSQEVPNFRGMNILTPTIVGDAVFTSSYRNKSFLFRIKKMGNEFTVETAWTNKLQGYMSSPVVIDGNAYLHLQNQRFACVDLQTGDILWTSKELFGKYCSAIANGDRILALDERGILLLIHAQPEKLEIVDKKTISDEATWAHLAVSGDELFVRELRAIAAYRWR